MCSRLFGFFITTEGKLIPGFYFATKLIEIDLAYWSFFQIRTTKIVRCGRGIVRHAPCHRPPAKITTIGAVAFPEHCHIYHKIGAWVGHDPPPS